MINKKITVRVLLTTAFFAALVAGCGHKKIVFNSAEGTASNGVEGKSLTVQVEWLKPKKKGIDMKLTLKNYYDHGIAFKKSAMRVTYNGQPGMIHKNDFSGELPGGAMETGLLLAEFETPVTRPGTAELIIDPISKDDESLPANKKKLPSFKITLPVQ